ncbi:MAG TPA: adenylate/guanylate cyclase domain-containing protein [Candidatus Eremiobacteraceae bacterium]|nr:adenylate/guanylate cyclase domain-containing protein [Candidatus Eremiobacteraceae bacterium]
MPTDGGAARARSSVSAVPSGTVTFLFSDIEGSTQRWESDRAAMDAALKRHDELVRDVFVRHNGFVFKTIGDAFCVAFQSAKDAVAAACATQRALAAEDFSSVEGLHVRMGLHTGSAEERDADFFGPTVNRVARLMSVGHGGQVLLSSITRELAQSSLPTGVTLIDLGPRRLKDLIQPEQVWQLSITGLPSEFPPLNSLDARANNLPIQATALIGREHDLEEVKALLGQHRLLTLFGAGGLGKTRLAHQVGADVLDRYPDGVWFADLAPIGDSELVASVIAKTVGMTQAAGQRVDEAIPKWLKRKQMLLILDNCEHVLESAAGIAAEIIGGCPGVRILATSRQALGVGGEVVHRLPSLAVPDSVAGLHAADALQFGAIALFADRARAVDTRFALTDDGVPIVAEICRRLDGIPLAIELAAARVKVLSIPNLARRLDDRFKVLTGGSRLALPRQKTLGALIDWSYNLLTPQEQRAFDRVGIFAGSFSLDAAAAVCSDDGTDELEFLDLLSSLADKSLLMADTSAAQERYRLLESTRAYALEKLTAAGERHRFAQRHAEYYRGRAQEADDSFGIGSTAAWRGSQELELDNYRGALEWALKEGHDFALGGAIAGALDRFWRVAGIAAEGRYWIGLAQAGLDAAANPREAARLWLALPVFTGGGQAEEAAQRALALYESMGDARGVARALRHVAFALSQMGRLDEATDALERALAAMRELGDRPGTATCLAVHAVILTDRGDIAAARESFAKAIEAARALGDEMLTASSLSNLAELEFRDARFSEALRLGKEALDLRMGLHDAASMASCYTNRAAYRSALGDVNGAREDARESLRWALKGQAEWLIAVALQYVASSAASAGEFRSAASLIGYVNARFNNFGYEREFTERWVYERLMMTLREHLDEAELVRLGHEGAAWSEDRAIEEAQKI